MAKQTKKRPAQVSCQIRPATNKKYLEIQKILKKKNGINPTKADTFDYAADRTIEQLK